MSEELTDRDLGRVRLRFLDLTKSFFQEMPDAERLSRWRGIFAALDGEQVAQPLDTSIQELGELLLGTTLQDIQEEYQHLFVDPYSKDLLPLTASYYIDGMSFGPSLAELRQIMKRGQVIIESDSNSPEDALPVMLDTLIALIGQEAAGECDTGHLQNQLLQQFLIPSVSKIGERIADISEAVFYQQCMRFLESYLDLELSLLKEEREVAAPKNRAEKLTRYK